MHKIFTIILALLLCSCTLNASYLEDLEENGYCVIPNIVSDEEAKLLYERVWHEFIEKAWPNCRMNDRSNWKEAFPQHNKVGIFAGPAGQTQVMWDIRQDVRIVDIFAKIWNTHDLIVSMDGMSLMCPTEIREGTFEPWPHVDQESSLKSGNESSLKSNPYTIQGQFLFEESSVGDGGFYCIPKSHLRFTEFAPQIEAITASQKTITEGRLARNAFFETFFDKNSYERKHVTAPRGSLILWDSRTVHWNQHASSERSNPKVRMVGYICYLPKKRLQDEGKAIRREAFERGISTTHDAAHPLFVPSKDGQLYPGYERYLEDTGYIQPQIQLTSLGRSLLGID